MKVILTKDVPSLGRAGDVKEVSDGHARNFLMPRHLALPATTEALSRIEKEGAERQAKYSKDREKFATLKHKIENQTITVRGKANKNSLFAAIHEDQIAKAIKENIGLEVDATQVHLRQPVKTLGIHTVEIRFAKDMVASVRLSVEKE
ncbi:MAG: 50S ribosomal protein L9 [Candidatus Doudnabacteria bacterium]|nr:50S ribosomal protein L9 [Candidatus Doudnabacteria bacterium]